MRSIPLKQGVDSKVISESKCDNETTKADASKVAAAKSSSTKVAEY